MAGTPIPVMQDNSSDIFGGANLTGISAILKTLLGQTTNTSEGGGTTVASGKTTDSGGTSTTQTQLSVEAENALVKRMLEATGGLADLSVGEKTSGTYNTTTKSLMTNDLLSRIAGDVAVKSAPTVTTKSPTSTTSDSTVAKPTTSNTTKVPGVGKNLLAGLALSVGGSALLKKLGGLNGISESLGFAGLSGGSGVVSAANGGIDSGALSAILNKGTSSGASSGIPIPPGSSNLLDSVFAGPTGESTIGSDEFLANATPTNAAFNPNLDPSLVSGTSNAFGGAAPLTYGPTGQAYVGDAAISSDSVIPVEDSVATINRLAATDTSRPLSSGTNMEGVSEGPGGAITDAAFSGATGESTVGASEFALNAGVDAGGGAVGIGGAAAGFSAASAFAFPLAFAIGDMMNDGEDERSAGIAAYESLHGPGSYAQFNADRTSGTGMFAPGTPLALAMEQMMSLQGDSTNAGG